MMSAVKTLTPSSLARSSASFSTLTSKARMHANSLRCRSSMTDAPMTSRLCTGPMEMPETGICTASLSRKARRASSEPRVEAWTYTPSPVRSTLWRMALMSLITSSLRSSTSSAGVRRCSCVPATAFSRSCATSLMPCAATISLWCMYCDLTRSSRSGCGVRSARTLVTIGPSRPATTTVAPSLSEPLSSTQSIVVPSPSTIFTSMTVHCTSSTYMSFSVMRVCGSLVMTWSKSGMPSPVMALVGTMERYLRGSGFSKYTAAFKPCS
mmetsp:Transcript_24788/g.81080  ORF Transcript_24788/g.81080 Transcript_24788/m.81080 type:complete len:267 (+) Transcript_24788:2071-2871(+)